MSEDERIKPNLEKAEKITQVPAEEAATRNVRRQAREGHDNT